MTPSSRASMSLDSSRIKNLYLDWLRGLVEDPSLARSLSHVFLFNQLQEDIFIADNEFDECQLKNGVRLRSIFADDNGLDLKAVRLVIFGSASTLEVMISLCMTMEDDILTNPYYGDRTSKWFTCMLDSLGLSSQTDSNYNPDYVARVLSNLATRSYSKNGSGGLFTTSRDDVDMRKLTLWDQACVFMNDILQNEEGIYYGR